MTIRHRTPNGRPGDQFLTVQEVADELRVSKMHVYRLIETGELRHLRTRRLIRVAERDLSDYITQAFGDH